ncbi:hypothetical protein [Salipiger mucosus]|uniref:Uncharacterized protein n=1 Tax=Salipiger mucosus DSM 16094 TaxID=1123237 RepID=S9QDY7_9RHOB|nr:hypothetical protein [Salipiger mucosus]EPX78102.1 hypothetical protein Salmuc_03451 [Salipiger mucosus DSM 16094]
MQVNLHQTIMEAPMSVEGVENVYVKGGMLCLMKKAANGNRETAKYPLAHIAKYETWMRREEVEFQDERTTAVVHLVSHSEPEIFRSHVAPEATAFLYRVFTEDGDDEVKVTSFPLINIFRVKER